MSDIVGHGFANVRRDRHAVVPLAFASNDEFTGAPVDIVELDSNDLLRPKAQTGKQKHHGVVTSAELGVASDGSENGLHLFRRDMTGKPGRRAVRHFRDAERQVRKRQPLSENRYWRKLRRYVARFLSR